MWSIQIIYEPLTFWCHAKKTYWHMDVGVLHTDGGIAESVAWGIAPRLCEKRRWKWGHENNGALRYVTMHLIKLTRLSKKLCFFFYTENEFHVCGRWNRVPNANKVHQRGKLQPFLALSFSWWVIVEWPTLRSYSIIHQICVWLGPESDFHGVSSPRNIHRSKNNSALFIQHSANFSAQTTFRGIICSICALKCPPKKTT